MIRGLDHVGIAVHSIEEVRPFYEALGLSIAAVEEVPVDGVRVALIPCGGTTLELLEPLAPDTHVGRFLARRGPGIHHLCLATDDTAEAGERLQAAGFRVLRPAPTRGAGGCWVNFVHPASAGGVLFELSQPPPDHEVRTGHSPDKSARSRPSSSPDPSPSRASS